MLEEKNKKRDYRSLWIARINAARINNLSYSKFMNGIKLSWNRHQQKDVI